MSNFWVLSDKNASVLMKLAGLRMLFSICSFFVTISIPPVLISALKRPSNCVEFANDVKLRVLTFFEI